MPTLNYKKDFYENVPYHCYTSACPGVWVCMRGWTIPRQLHDARLMDCCCAIVQISFPSGSDVRPSNNQDTLDRGVLEDLACLCVCLCLSRSRRHTHMFRLQTLIFHTVESSTTRKLKSIVSPLIKFFCISIHFEVSGLREKVWNIPPHTGDETIMCM